MATLKHSVHIGRTEMTGLLREGKTLADFLYVDELTTPMFDELAWWTATLSAGRNATR